MLKFFRAILPCTKSEELAQEEGFKCETNCGTLIGRLTAADQLSLVVNFAGDGSTRTVTVLPIAGALFMRNEAGDHLRASEPGPKNFVMVGSRNQVVAEVNIDVDREITIVNY